MGFLYALKVLSLVMVMAKENLDYDFSSWCNLRLKFGKITSGFTLTEQWEAGNFPIVFWFVTSETEYSEFFEIIEIVFCLSFNNGFLLII